MKPKILITLLIGVLLVCSACTAVNQTQPTPSPATEPTPIPTKAAEQLPSGPVALEQSELDFFTEYFNMIDNNGFLRSDFDTPAGMDLIQVFYSGAGIEQQEITEPEKQAYIGATGQEEIYLAMIKLTTDQINTFLQDKAGISLEDVTAGFDWTYLEQYDAYYHESGDTNYDPYICINGTKNGDLYEINCKEQSGGTTLTVTLQKTADKFLFVSNQVYPAQ